MTEPMKPGEIIDMMMELLEHRVLFCEARLDGIEILHEARLDSIEGMLEHAGIKQAPSPCEPGQQPEYKSPTAPDGKGLEASLASLQREMKAMTEKVSRLDEVAHRTGLHLCAENYMDPIDDMFHELYRRVWELETKRRRPG